MLAVLCNGSHLSHRALRATLGLRRGAVSAMLAVPSSSAKELLQGHYESSQLHGSSGHVTSPFFGCVVCAALRGHGDVARALIDTLPDDKRAKALTSLDGAGRSMAHICLMSK